MSGKSIDTSIEARKMGILLAKKGKFFDALVCYNKSLCFAPSHSTAKANAYKQRAALYKQAKVYDKCLENVQKAFDSKHPKPEEIEVIREECHEKMKTNGDPSFKPIKLELSYPAHEKLPFMVDCLELHRDESGNPHVYTTRDLKVGDIIALAEPISPILNKDQVYQRCSYCCKDNSLDLEPCPSCVNGEKRMRSSQI